MAAATPTDTSVDANDIGMLAMSTDRRLHTDAQIVGQDADITIADGGNVITVDGTVTANLSATDNAVLDTIDAVLDLINAKLVTGTDIGDVTVNNAASDPVFVAPRNDDDATAFQFADINDAGSGDNTIIAAAGASKHIAVWSVFLISDGTVDARWEDGAAGTAITGQVPLQVREGYSYSAGGLVPLWVGSANTLLNLELSAAVNVHGSVSYSVLDT